jgi:iron complex outermembrane receptor protein
MRPTSRWATILFAPAVLLPLGCGAPVGSIAGKVTDTGGAAVAGAAVTTDPATVGATTDAEGRYALADIAAGTCKVIVVKTGFITTPAASPPACWARSDTAACAI